MDTNVCVRSTMEVEHMMLLYRARGWVKRLEGTLTNIAIVSHVVNISIVKTR